MRTSEIRNNEAMHMVSQGRARIVRATKIDTGDWVDGYCTRVDPIYVGPVVATDEMGKKTYSVVVAR